MKSFDKKGFIFVTVVALCTLMFLITGAFYFMVSNDLRLVRQIKRKTQALYLAEAGINKALSTLMSDFANKDSAANFPLTSLGDGTYDVTVTEVSSRVLLTSEGAISDATRQVSLEVAAERPEALNNALSVSGNIDITSVQGAVTITGDMHSNGNTVLRANASGSSISATGAVSASGNVTIDGSVTYGDLLQGQPSQPIPVFDFNLYRTEAINGGAYYSGDQTFNGASLSSTTGIIYVDGNATFKGDNTIVGGFVATGNIELNNNNSITQAHDSENRFPVFISQGNMKMYGLFQTSQGNIVYSAGNLKIQTPAGISNVMGSVLAKGNLEITANGDITVNYAEVESEGIPMGVKLVSWTR